MRIKFKAFYFIQFLSFGILGPYLALYLTEKGFSGAQIGMLIGTIPIISIFFQPIWGAFSDMLQKRRLPLIIGCLGVSGATIGIAFANGFTANFLFFIFFAVFITPISPIGTAIVLDYLDQIKTPEDFSLIRVWGSIAYGVSSLVLGSLLMSRYLPLFPWIVVGIYLLLALVSFLLPEDHKITSSHPAVNKQYLSHLFVNTPFVIFILGMIFIGATLNIALNYQVLFLQSINAMALLIGIAVSLPSLLEIPMMMLVPAVLKHLSMRQILVAGALLLPIRWAMFYFIQDPGWMIPVQILNFVATIAFEVIGVSYVDKNTPLKWRATGQGLYATAMFGLGPGIGNFAAGNVMERFNIRSVWRLNFILGVIGLALVVLSVKYFSNEAKKNDKLKNSVDC